MNSMITIYILLAMIAVGVVWKILRYQPQEDRVSQKWIEERRKTHGEEFKEWFISHD